MPGIIWLRTAFFALYLSQVLSYQYSKKEEECMIKSKLYHPATDQCYDLLNQGPCPDGEWFVLRKPTEKDAEDIIKGVCVPDRCGESAYFWSRESECVKSKDKERLCGTSPTVYLGNNDFGEAGCICLKSPPHSRLEGDPEKPCYELYRKGPCKRGQIFGYPTSDADAAVCMNDPCYAESRDKKASGKIPHNATLAMYEGKCYELQTQGPCPNDTIFQFNHIYKSLNCTAIDDNFKKRVNINKINFGECMRGPDGACAETVTFTETSSPRSFKRDKAKKRSYIEFLKCKRNKMPNCVLELKSSSVNKIDLGDCATGADGTCMEAVSLQSVEHKVGGMNRAEYLRCLKAKKPNCVKP